MAPSVRGGCLEAKVYDTALAVLADEQPRSLQFRLTKQDSPDSGLMCGGEVIFVEPITTRSGGAMGRERVTDQILGAGMSRRRVVAPLSLRAELRWRTSAAGAGAGGAAAAERRVMA